MPITVNRSDVPLPEDARVSLLDFSRDRLGLSGTKKGCNQGACGACTVLVDGQRILSCLALAVQYDGRSITTIEGLATDPHAPMGAWYRRNRHHRHRRCRCERYLQCYR